MSYKKYIENKKRKQKPKVFKDRKRMDEEFEPHPYLPKTMIAKKKSNG